MLACAIIPHFLDPLYKLILSASSGARALFYDDRLPSSIMGELNGHRQISSKRFGRRLPFGTAYAQRVRIKK
jgi:hypothetical protein